MEFFLNPWAMVAGGAMISAPILIHLINRMRFKRIRWAAMEFLLKSQKRNRRRLIIEQIILLMLRCLMMVLAGLLLARFIGLRPPSESDSDDPKLVPGTLHVALLDDSLSTTDRTPAGKDGNTEPDAFSLARKRIKELAERAAGADTVQHLRIVLMSSQQVVFEGDPREPGALDLLAAKMKDVQAKMLHAPPINGLKKCKELLEQLPEEQAPEVPIEANKKDAKEKQDDKDKQDDKEKKAKPSVRPWHKRLYVYSDFRDSDWGRRVDTGGLYRLMDEICEAGANLWLVDVAAPLRPSGADQAVDYHDNYAITNLRPEKRVAPGNSVVTFTVEITNYGRDTRDSLLMNVFLDGKPEYEATKLIDAPGPGRTVRPTFDILFVAPEDGAQAKHHRITAQLQTVDVESGLLADNIRHTTIEIRRDVPTLVIDGAGDTGLQPGGDTNVIKNALESAKGSETTKVVAAGVSELLRDDLEREYAAIYLVNVESLKLADAKKGEENLPLERLKKFVRNGGNVVFFTGPRIDARYYYKTLFQEAEGLFPVPLEIENPPVTKIDEKEIEARRGSSAPKIYTLDPDHPVTVGIAPLQYGIPDLIITQYTPTKERFEWEKERSWSKKDDLKELISLASLTKVSNATRDKLQKLLARIPVNDAAYRKYQPLLKKHKDALEQLMLDAKADQMYLIAQGFEAMLNDKGDKPKDKDNVSLLEFWARPDQKDLRDDLLDFRRVSLYGPPLAVTSKYGKGNVVAFLTTAGTTWSGWSGGKLGGVSAFTFPMVMVDLQKFLTTGGAGTSHLVGETLKIELDAKRYKSEIERFVQVEETLAKEGGVDKSTGLPAGFLREKRSVQRVGDKYVFTFPVIEAPGQSAISKAGVNIFRLSLIDKNEPEDRWMAFNVDTSNESNLKRVASNEAARNPANPAEGRGSTGWYNAEDPDDPAMQSKSDKKNTKEDLSHGPWLFLLFLVILVVEQALAVHLSFHAKRNEAAA